MKTLQRTLALLVIIGALLTSGLAAQEADGSVENGAPAASSDDGESWSRLGITLKAGTLGAGADATLRIFKGLNLRAGVAQGSFTYSALYDGIDYEVDATLETGAIMLDWHPFRNGFRITAGAVQNNNELTLTADPDIAYEVGGVTYTASDLLSLKGKVDFADVASYVGIGFGNAAGKGHVSLSLDIGVMMHGNPRITMEASGPATSFPGFYDELARETKLIEEDLKEYKYYPVVMIGLSISF